MKSYNVHESMLGSGADEAQARRMVELLNERGIDAVYGFDLNRMMEVRPEIEAAWQECLEAVGLESMWQSRERKFEIDNKVYTLNELAAAVSDASSRGLVYEGLGSTHIVDWLAEGDYDGSETIESLAADWDA